jgi:hypothetical protein
LVWASAKRSRRCTSVWVKRFEAKGEKVQGDVKRKRTAIVIGAVLAAVCVQGSVRLGAETLERVLAVVGGQLITLTDVTAARDFGLVIVAPGAGDPIRAALTQLIDRELMLAEVDRYAPPEPSADAIAAALRIVRQRFADDGAYQAALARSGIAEDHLRDTLRQNLRVTAYLSQRFVVAPPNDISARPPLPDRQRGMIDDWLAGLRRRATIIDLYLTSK